MTTRLAVVLAVTLAAVTTADGRQSPAPAPARPPIVAGRSRIATRRHLLGHRSRRGEGLGDDARLQRVGEIVSGRRAITADTDLRLCRFFGLSNGYWLRAQVAHDTEVARETLAETLKKIRPWKPTAA